MPDVFTKAKRSAVMSLIRGSGNKDTELRMIALFRAHGIVGWRRRVALFGKPDFVFRRERVVVFVDGCFWHGCPRPKHAPLPKNRADWWATKLARNKERDRLVTRTLRAGWLARGARVGVRAYANAERATAARIGRVLVRG
jgi:DNA mismatch endonuclease (patch repair protein)